MSADSIGELEPFTTHFKLRNAAAEPRMWPARLAYASIFSRVEIALQL